MSNNMYMNYDPLYANGILPAPMKDIIFTQMPVDIKSTQKYYPNVNSAQSDSFSPSFKDPEPLPFWKKALFYTGLATITLFGLKKAKINPFKKVTSSPKFQGIKDLVVDKFNVVKNFITNKFKKP